jgi:competence protein ComGC
MLGTAALVSAATRWLSFQIVLFCATVILLLFIPLLIKAASPKNAGTAMNS